MTKQKFGLTDTALKTIALVLMVMDHIHYFFEFTGVVPEWFSMLARLSAPRAGRARAGISADTSSRSRPSCSNARRMASSSVLPVISINLII